MTRANEITEQLASAALLADPTDLPALADLHEKLANASKQLSGEAGVGEAQAKRIATSAGTAAKLVEQIILREATDAAAALDGVCRQIAEI